MPHPHVLVLDLENTLVSSSWDRKKGWRYAKRPGVQKFLNEMTQYFEIVIYSPSDMGVADPVVTALDPQGTAMHRLYRESCHRKDGVYMKDLSSLNRDLRRVILIDDDEEAASLNPDNFIRIKPYDDPSDRTDNTLERITPFLMEIVSEGYNVPEVLHQFQGMDADEIADEHERRVADLQKARSSQRGLSAFSGAGRRYMPEPEMKAVPESKRYKGAEAQPALTSKDLVGSSPDDTSKSAGISGWMQRRQEQKQKENDEKMLHWQRIMADKQEQKAREEESRAA